MTCSLGGGRERHDRHTNATDGAVPSTQEECAEGQIEPLNEIDGFCPSESLEATIPYMSGTFYHGDNLDVLRYWIDDESIDLVYLDPPFNSQQDFNLPFGSEEARPVQVRAFRDTWWWDETAARVYDELTRTNVEHLPEKIPGMMRALYEFLYPQYKHHLLAYLVNMTVRLVELRRVMTPTASLYLHCDPRASHYLKMILDAIFGIENFRNEVVWKRSYGHGGSNKHAPVHDVMLFYSKSSTFTWNPLWKKLPQKTVDEWYNNIEEGTERRFNRADLTGSGTRGGESGKAWRGIDVTAKGRHWAIPRSIKIVEEICGGMKTHEALDALDDAGRIHWPDKADGVPMFKRYLEEATGIAALDVILGIPHLHNKSPERVGYPTQKPLALLKHVIELSSNPGDLVLDPFCGCGTSVIACEQLQREWVGIDIGDEAIAVLRDVRLPKEAPGTIINEVIEPFDAESARRLAAKDEYEFQWWAVRKLGGQPVGGIMKKGGDRGIDGELFIEDHGEERRRRRILVSVKTGSAAQPAWVDQLHSAVTNPENRAHMGILVSLEVTRGMKDRAREFRTIRATSVGQKDPYKIQIVTPEDLFTQGMGIDLPGRNVTPTPARPIQKRSAVKGQLAIPFDDVQKNPRVSRSKIHKPGTKKSDTAEAAQGKRRSVAPKSR